MKKGIWPFRYTWMSICGIHYDYNDDCNACRTGIWDNDVKLCFNRVVRYFATKEKHIQQEDAEIVLKGLLESALAVALRRPAMSEGAHERLEEWADEAKSLTTNLPMIVDLGKLHRELGLTERQKTVLSDSVETLMNHYACLSLRSKDSMGTQYFAGVSDGLNNAYKVINEIDDDYNASDKL